MLSVLRTLCSVPLVPSPPFINYFLIMPPLDQLSKIIPDMHGLIMGCIACIPLCNAMHALHVVVIMACNACIALMHA